ncbi:isoprenoid synthase domain-containing protein [Favolaschia claudopus]|uniref:Isoprenoid synthase domain-containing protein n=1 Tax=Favolaschia claudopus TaxID=2862362 RepID=A0AAW0AQL4_9AGAR
MTLATATLRRIFSATESGELEPVSDTIRSFLDHMMYIPPTSDDSRREKLVCALEEHMYLWGVLPASNGLFIHQTCKHSAAMAELSYHLHDFDTQLQIAKFTWFMIYIDDLASNMPSVLQDFQMKLLRRETPDHPVLHYFAGHLLDMYNFWDGLAANGITTAALEFITGCALEIHTEIRKIKLDSSSASWPYFLRARTGVAPAYAFMIFRAVTSNMSQYIQVIPDVCLFIDLTNDVLSFYKEELAGETGNYIHNRAGVTGKPPTHVLAEVAAEALAAHDRVTVSLHACQSQGLDAWMTFVHGYLAFHLTQDRYKLKDLLC